MASRNALQERTAQAQDMSIHHGLIARALEVDDKVILDLGSLRLQHSV